MKIAFVAPFYGRDASGGAEAECRNTALRIAERPDFEVDILTTCLLDLAHGITVNAHPPGKSHDENLTVRRFPAEVFDPGPFGEINARIIAGEKVSDEDERRFMARNVNSFALYRYIAEHSNDYDWFCFIPYLFGTSCYGSQICPEKSILIPCLHDEGYARLSLVRSMIESVATIVFHTPAEMQLAEEIYGPEPRPEQRKLIGEGVELHFEADANRFREKFGIAEPFIMYAGRKDATKNVPQLINCFSNYIKTGNAGDLKLVMVGPCEADIPNDMRDRIIDLGFVDEQDKKDAYAAAMVLCQPSLNESFSIVMMEAWACGTPCLVHAGCAVTREHIVRSGGGLYFENCADFGGALDYMQKNPDIRNQMGACGREFAISNFDWPAVIDRYCTQVFVTQ